MDKLEKKGSWLETKGKLKTMFAELTDNDLMYEVGQEDTFIGNLAKKLGKSKDEMIRVIKEL